MIILKSFKAFIITGVLFVSIIGTLFHFIYNWSGDNVLIGLIAPVNESVWEHMKLIFFPMLFFSIYSKFRFKNISCLNSALLLGTLLGTFIIPILFYTYTGILGRSISIIDISIFYISVIIAFYFTYKTKDSCKVERYKNILYILVIMLIIAFILFTFSPPDIAIFNEP